MKVFKLNDCEWWIGHDLESCIQQAMTECGVTREDAADDPHELTDEELDRLMFVNEDGTKHSFRIERDRQIAAGVTTSLFACTEY